MGQWNEERLDAIEAACKAEPGVANVELARRFGIQPKDVRHYKRRLAELGRYDMTPAMPGFRIHSVNTGPRGTSVKQVVDYGDQHTVPDGMRIKSTSTLVGPDGRVMMEWRKASEEQDPLRVAERVAELLANYEPAAQPRPGPPDTSADLLTLLPCNDWHLGMYAWAKEVGQNWDLSIAKEEIGAAVSEALLGSRPSATCVVLVGGDLLHSDNNLNRTARSGNVLDVDGRHGKVLDTAVELLVQTIDLASSLHARVVVRVLPGNHDEQSARSVAKILKAWYRMEPRIEVDDSEDLFWWYLHGKVLLGSTHGHTVKINRMPQIMANRCSVWWGESRFRYVHGFHLHHTEKLLTEDGVISEIHQAPIPDDTYHHGAGYLSGRSVQTIAYHTMRGEVFRNRVPILTMEADYGTP